MHGIAPEMAVFMNTLFCNVTLTQISRQYYPTLTFACGKTPTLNQMARVINRCFHM